MPELTYDPESYRRRVAEIGVGSLSAALQSDEMQSLDKEMDSLIQSIRNQ